MTFDFFVVAFTVVMSTGVLGFGVVTSTGVSGFGVLGFGVFAGLGTFVGLGVPFGVLSFFSFESVGEDSASFSTALHEIV